MELNYKRRGIRKIAEFLSGVNILKKILLDYSFIKTISMR